MRKHTLGAALLATLVLLLGSCRKESLSPAGPNVEGQEMVCSPPDDPPGMEPLGEPSQCGAQPLPQHRQPTQAQSPGSPRAL